MVDDTQNYWVFGLFPSFGILGNRGHDVSETGSVSVFGWERKTPTRLGPLERANVKTSCPLLPKIPDEGKSPKSQ
jgi:hypothetical protein